MKLKKMKREKKFNPENGMRTANSSQTKRKKIIFLTRKYEKNSIKKAKNFSIMGGKTNSSCFLFFTAKKKIEKIMSEPCV